MEYAILENIDAKNKTRYWSITIKEKEDYFVLEIVAGLKDGKKIISKKEISQQKNIGKKNETTLQQQSISEANTLIRKKEMMGYHFIKKPENYCYTKNCKEKSFTEIYPMLCEKYNPKHIIYPSYVQPKLDGVRAIYINNNLESRSKKIFTSVNHILEELKIKIGDNYILDGELYNHRLDFQKIISQVSSKEYDNSDIEYHIFDIIDLEKPFKERLLVMEELEKSFKFTNIRFVKTIICNTLNDIYDNIKYFGNYEGVIIRNPDGLYKPKYRSKNCLKFKQFIDEEFEITGFTEGKGAEKGCVLWECKTNENETFMVRPMGTREERAELFLNGNKYISKKLTVKYQEKTNKNIPRFPVGIAIRDYE